MILSEQIINGRRVRIIVQEWNGVEWGSANARDEAVRELVRKLKEQQKEQKIVALEERAASAVRLWEHARNDAKLMQQKLDDEIFCSENFGIENNIECSWSRMLDLTSSRIKAAENAIGVFVELMVDREQQAESGQKGGE